MLPGTSTELAAFQLSWLGWIPRGAGAAKPVNSPDVRVDSGTNECIAFKARESNGKLGSRLGRGFTLLLLLGLLLGWLVSFKFGGGLKRASAVLKCGTPFADGVASGFCKDLVAVYVYLSSHAKLQEPFSFLGG